ncbi:MAG: hypothetical protein ABW252_14390 [Polyangiales bacterium]
MSRWGLGSARASLWPALLIVAIVAASGCAGHSARTVEARKALDRHDAKAALDLYDKELGVTSGSEMPKQVSGDNALLLLDRSTILQQLTQYRDSSRDLETADKQVEMLDFTRAPAHEIGRYLFSDDTGPYKARPFEKLFVNTLNMVNYLAQGNLQGAKVEARRLAVMQSYLTQVEDDPAATLLGPGSYLAGFIFERAGEYDEALRYYDEALKSAPYTSLAGPVRRCSEFSGYKSPRIRELLEQKVEKYDEKDADILVVVSHGRVPALAAQRVPIGLALTAGAIYLDGAQTQAARRLAGQGLVSWVNYPDLDPSPRAALGAPGIEVDQKLASIDVITQVDTLVKAAFEKAKGPIMASAVVRMIARGAAGAAVGVGAGKAAKSSALGMLLALGTQAALSAADTPDTRSWATLPARVTIGRARVAPGSHTVRVVVQGVSREQTVEVAKGGFAVVSMTELSQQ